MPHRIARTFGSRAEPRAVTGESGLPTGAPLPDGADRRPPGFGEAPQPLMQEHPLVSGTGGPDFVPHRPPRPEKSEGGIPLRIQSELEPKGDQPTAIAELVAQVNAHERDQVLLGVTGSGKTFTMAKVIEAMQRPALILAPNKTLAAQLYGEFKSLLPGERGRVFRLLLRLLPARSLYPAHRHLYREGFLDQRGDRPHAPFGDARDPGARRRDHRGQSVSCIYGIGSVETYSGTAVSHRSAATSRPQRQLMADLVALQYRRNDDNFVRGAFRVRGDTIDSSRRITKTAPGASSCSATRWKASPSSIR